MSKSKALKTFLIVLIIGLGVFVYIRYFYVFSSGVKAGQLNYVDYKGYVFKTYEGRLIQAGYKPSQGMGVQSNEFIFSIADEKVAKELMVVGGQEVQLHYKQYLAPVPWRGFSKYIVDSIIEIKAYPPN